MAMDVTLHSKWEPEPVDLDGSRCSSSALYPPTPLPHTRTPRRSAPASEVAPLPVLLDATLATSRDLRIDTRTARLGTRAGAASPGAISPGGDGIDGGAAAAGLPAGRYLARLRVIEAAALEAHVGSLSPLDGTTRPAGDDHTDPALAAFSEHGGLAALELILNSPPAYGRLALSPLAGEARRGSTKLLWHYFLGHFLLWHYLLEGTTCHGSTPYK